MDNIDDRLRQSLRGLTPGSSGFEQTMNRVEAHRRRRRRSRSAVAVVLLAGAVSASVVGLTGPTSPALATTVPLPGKIVDVAATADRIWALTCTHRCAGPESAGRLVVVDARSGRVATIRDAASPQAVAAGYDSVWVAHFAESTIERIDAADPGQQSVTIPLELPRPVAAGDRRFLPVDVTVGPDGVWASSARGYVVRIDPASNEVTAMIRTTADSTGPVVAGNATVWIGEGLRLGRIDTYTNSVSRFVIDGPGDRRLAVGSVIMGRGRLWVGGEWARPTRDTVGHPDYTLTGEAALAEVDASTGEVRSTSPLSPGTTLQGGDAGKLWLTNTRKRMVYEYSVAKRTIVATAHVRAVGPVIAAQGSRVWLASTSRELRSVRLVRRAPALRR